MKTGTATPYPVFILLADRRIMEKQSTDTAPRGVRKTIGRTTYVVSAHGNEKSNENVKNKLKRMILNDRKALKTLASKGDV